MLEHIPDEVRLKVLIGFTRSLILNSRNTEIFRLDEIVKEHSSLPLQKISRKEMEEKIKEDLKEKIKEEVKEKLAKEKLIIQEDKNEKLFNQSPHEIKKDFFKSRPRVQLTKPAEFQVKRSLKIPRVSFPPHLRSVKPFPSNNISMDLGKLNPFIQDSNVTSLESEGENEPVCVIGSMGRKPTNVKLSKREIDEVIHRFSEKSRIPKSEGMFKVAVGKLLLTAMISSSVSPRFVIEKLRNNNLPKPGRY